MVLFIYSFFFKFVYDQTQALNCWNINTWKMLRILFSLLYVKYIFLSFYGSVGFEENKYAKKGITAAMECAGVTGFTFGT